MSRDGLMPDDCFDSEDGPYFESVPPVKEAYHG